jgi:DNA-binding NarL/FixJ family response regulator
MILVMHLVKTLLADDHALIRAGLRDALTGIPNIEIAGEVSNGRQLTTALETLTPDLLVLDVNMPEFDPIAAVRWIRSHWPDMKILVVSAYDDQAYVVGLLSAGVNGYHLKDQPLSDLQLAVQRILDGGRWLSDPLVERLVDHKTSPGEPGLPALTRRQRELLYFLSQGYNNQRIALTMELSVKTIENHLTALYRAIRVESRLEANSFSAKHPDLLIHPGTAGAWSSPDSTSVDTMTVLLVDDNPRYRAQLAKLLGKICPPSAIYEAEDTSDAVRLAKKEQPRLAFIDVVLRDEDGIQCARRIRSASAATRVILISAYPDREFRRMGMSAGAVAFLDKKDIDAETIRQVVNDALEGT